MLRFWPYVTTTIGSQSRFSENRFFLSVFSTTGSVFFLLSGLKTCRIWGSKKMLDLLYKTLYIGIY